VNELLCEVALCRQPGKQAAVAAVLQALRASLRKLPAATASATAATAAAGSGAAAGVAGVIQNLGPDAQVSGRGHKGVLHPLAQAWSEWGRVTTSCGQLTLHGLRLSPAWL
jgi:hypothetical protein